MHPWILGAALFAAGSTCLAAPAPAPFDCPRAGAPAIERFVSADCPGCWADDAAPADPARAWVFDWIVPAGDAAALAAAASTDAAARQQRAGPAASPAGRATHTLATGLQLRVNSGPAWSGYMGVQLEARGRAPAGATAWLALVEMLPAQAEGNAQPRRLVRAVAGPLALDGLAPGQPLKPLRAMRWPEGALPERLQARAWVEAADGRILAVAHERCRVARH